MSLQAKVLNLKLQAARAAKHALWWEKQIHTHGEEKAEAFYKHLGLNHIEKKSYEWEGLKLSREPKEHEKICVKGIADAQESAKNRIGTILLSLRKELISDGLKGISRLKPAEYHELVLSASSESRSDLRDRLLATYKQGRNLIAIELGDRKATAKKEFDELDTLTDLTDARVANDVQSRIIAAATRFRLLGLIGQTLLAAISAEIEAGSVSYIDRASTGLANKVISIGRGDEAQDRKDDWVRVEYSALLDQNVCSPCAAEDGKEAADEEDLTPTPNPDCLGGDWCRCFHVYVNQ
jgi:hypothetical protein